NRVELARERMLDLQLNLTRILSEEQDLDYAEAIMELKMEEFAYRTALAVGARIIQPSLVDFLR
ncbi:MAG: flagellar hook-associated protein FlgL, partial [Limnochordia bacterium]